MANIGEYAMIDSWFFKFGNSTTKTWLLARLVCCLLVLNGNKETRIPYSSNSQIYQVLS